MSDLNSTICELEQLSSDRVAHIIFNDFLFELVRVNDCFEWDVSCNGFPGALTLRIESRMGACLFPQVLVVR